MKNKFKIVFVLITIMFVMSGLVYGIDNSIYQDKISIFQNIKLEEGKSIFGDMVAIFGDVMVDGSANGDIVSIFGDITVNGNTGGDAISVFGNVRVNGNINGDAIAILGGVDMGSNSNINGSRIQILGGGIDIPQNARINGENFDLPIFKGTIDIKGIAIFWGIFAVFMSIISIGLSFLLVAVIPKNMNNIKNQYDTNILRRFGIGLLLYIVYLVILSVLIITLIGIPLIPVILLVMSLIGFGGKTSVRMFIGKKVKGEREWSIYKELFIGSIIYLLIDITVILKPVLYIGKIIGVGTIIDTKIGSDKYCGEKSKVIINE